MLQELAGLTVETREPTEQRHPHPLLLIHGMWEGAWIWHNYLHFFAERGYVCYALNLRGHDPARPDPRLGKLRIDEYVADVKRAAAELGNPILIAHSMGGLVAQKVAEQTRPPAVVAIAPAAPRGIFALNTWALLTVSVRHSPEILLGRPLMLSQGEMNRLLLNRMPPDQQRRAYAKMVPESGRQTFDIAVAGLPVDAAQVKSPLLVLGAGHDQITPAKMVAKIARKYQAEYRRYEGFAHMVMLEDGWEQPARDVADWLDGLDLDRA